MVTGDVQRFWRFALGCLAVWGVLQRDVNAASNVITWPAPVGEAVSLDYAVGVDGVSVFVHQARVRAKILKNNGLWTHEVDCKGETASFAIFDIRAKVAVAVKPSRVFRTAVVLPASAGVVSEIVDGTVRSVSMAVRMSRYPGLPCAGAAMVPSVLIGADAGHQVENVVLRGIHFQGKPAVADFKALRIHTNAFVCGLRLER